MAATTKRYAVVTGGNKGIGLQICKQLASNGVTVVLTARDQKRGLEALDKLMSESGGLSGQGQVFFHQLDVTDPAATLPSLANFITANFGKLDILVNNAGISGLQLDKDALMTDGLAARIERGETVGLSKTILAEDYEAAEASVRTNYYGPKGMCEGLIPLLELSASPRIVNVSASLGSLEKFPSGWGKEVLSDAEGLTEEKVDEVLMQFLADFKEASLETKGWPTVASAYAVSKAALNAYTRILAKKYPSFCVNSVCPGYVKTDMNFNSGYYTVDEGAESIVRLALLPDGNHSGLFFRRSDIVPF